ncbi:MAG: AsmA family protein [Elusimicrobia bacterium]|nr:AsmA family protein [Elusimicrobiota bacterium]
MKKALVWTALITAGLVGGLALLGVWFRHQYPPERLRQMASEAAGARLGRRIEVAGARVSLLKGLELNGVRISEQPDFSAGTFFSAESVRVLPRLVPLMSGRLVVRRVELDRPSIRLHRLSADTFNFSSLGAAPAGPSAPPRGGAFSTLFISEAVVHKGTLLFQDDVAKINIQLNGLESRVSGLSLTDPFGAKIDATTEIQYAHTQWKGPLSVQARLSLSGDKAVVIQKLSWGLGSSSINARGTLTPFPEPRVEATLVLNTLSAVDLNPLVQLPAPFQTATLSGRWTVKGTSSVFRTEGEFDVKSPAVDFSGKLVVAKDRARYTAQLDPTSVRLDDNPWIPACSARGPLRGPWTGNYADGNWTVQGTLTADGARISCGEWITKPVGSSIVLNASGASSREGEPRLTLDVRAPDLNLSPQGPWPSGITISGNLGVTAELKGTPSLMAFSVTADGQSLEARFKSSFQKPADSALFLSADGELARSEEPGVFRVELSSSTLHTVAGDATARGTVVFPRAIDMDIESQIPDLSTVQKMLPSLTNYRLRGRSILSAQVTGSIEDPAVQGQIRLSLGSITPIPGVALSNLNSHIEWADETVELKSLQGTAFGSPFRLAGRIDHAGKRPLVFLNGDWEKMQVEKVLKIFSSSAPAGPSTPASKEPARAPLARAEGVFRIGEIAHPHYRGRDFQFNWNFSDVGPNLSLLSGTATVTAASGEIMNVPVAEKINGLIDREGSDLGYKKLAGRFLVTRGVAQIPSFTLNSDQTDFSATGQVRLGGMESDLKLVLKLPAGSVRGSVGQWMTAEDGRPTIEARLKGPLRDPQVKVDYRDTVKRAAQDILKKTLGGWKGKPSQPAQTPSTQ